jgi:hypothetical protein
LENNPCYVPDMEGGNGINTALAAQSAGGGTIRGGSGDSAQFGTTRGVGVAADLLGAGAGINGAKAPPKKSGSVFKFLSKDPGVDAQAAFLVAIVAGDDKKVKDMMKKRKKGGIDMAAYNSDGLTPITLAVTLGNDDVVGAIVSSRELLKDEINLRDKFGYTPLHWCAAAVGVVRALTCVS